MSQAEHSNDELLDALDGRLTRERKEQIARAVQADPALSKRMDDVRRLRSAFKLPGAVAHLDLSAEARADALARVRETLGSPARANSAPLPFPFPGRWTRLVTWFGAAAATLLVVLYALDPPVSREAMDVAGDAQRRCGSTDSREADKNSVAMRAGDDASPQAASPTTKPRSVPQPGPTVSEPSVPGDADGDGALTVADSVLILRAALGKTPGNPAGCDMDHNGRVDARDYHLALRALLDEEIG